MSEEQTEARGACRWKRQLGFLGDSREGRRTICRELRSSPSESGCLGGAYVDRCAGSVEMPSTACAISLDGCTSAPVPAGVSSSA